MKKRKAEVYLASPVFREIADHPKVSVGQREKIAGLWKELHAVANVTVSTGRFPERDEILEVVSRKNIDFIGCHLSHQISGEVMAVPSVKGVCTSTAGFNHIDARPGVLVTHTPGVLDRAVADFTIALILDNLRNITGRHNFLWQGGWKEGQKWDLDDNLTNTVDHLTIGIVGLGEIAQELVRRVSSWGVKVLYHSRTRKQAFEEAYPNLSYAGDLGSVFSRSDIVSLHVPLDENTRGLVDETRLRMMKPGALLVNTARGEVVDFPALIRLLKSGEVSINLALDVFDPEPLPPAMLDEFREIAEKFPELKFTFVPHNASSDADTRAEMAAMMLADLVALIKSEGPEGLGPLRLIPPQKGLKEDLSPDKMEPYRISQWWI